MKDTIIQVLIVVTLVVAADLSLLLPALQHLHAVPRDPVGAAGAAAGGGPLRRGPRPHRSAATSTKPLTMIVPAYNEEVTIVDSVTNLIHCDYPRFEIVVVNDGSADRTLERLKQAFRLRRTDIPYREAIGTARCARMYEATIPLPPNVMQRRRDRQGERRQGRRPQRRHQRLDRALFRLARRRLDPRPARAQGADAGDPGGPAGGRGRRPGGHRQRLHDPEQPRRTAWASRPARSPGSRWWSICGRSPPGAPGSTGWTRSSS